MTKRFILFNKPYQVACQFSPLDNKKTLADFINIPEVYPAGRLDYDSEGLLILTNDGKLQHQISHPKNKLAKTYWVQVDGDISSEAIEALQQGVMLKDGQTKPATAKIIQEPQVWQRNPPIRFRANIPTSWIELSIKEGKNRQVRRMTAAVGFATLRLIRVAIGAWNLLDINNGDYQSLDFPSQWLQQRSKDKHKK